MIFYIEEVSDQDAIYSYQCSCIFDELIEFYAFLTQCAVEKVPNEESTEKFFYKHATAVELQGLIETRFDKMLFILSNLEKRIKGSIENERSQDKLKRCQDELSDQGILDILMCILEIFYYKSVPPTMFMKAFKEKQIEN